MENDAFDLFGNPVRLGRGKRGRPAFEVTERNLNKVKLLLALGWSNDRVANAIECSLATLKRHFRAALQERDKMRDRLEAERIMRAAEEAAKGNVGAMRQLGQMIDRNDRMEAERRIEAQPKTSAPGKKDLARIDARGAEDQLQAELLAEAGLLDVRH